MKSDLVHPMSSLLVFISNLFSTLLPSFFAEWPEGFTDADSGDFEQHITIVPNPKAKR